MWRLSLTTLVIAGGCAYERPLGAGPDATSGEPDAARLVDSGLDAAPACVDSACPSGVCDGAACVPVDNVRYVAKDALRNVSCSQARPCPSIAEAWAAAPAGPAFVVVESGTYNGELLVPGGELTIVGSGDTAPLLTSGQGSPIDVHDARLTLRHLQLSSTLATSEGAPALACGDATVSLDHVTVRDGTGEGVRAVRCDLGIIDSRITSNARYAVTLDKGSLSLYRTIVRDNAMGGVVAQTPGSCTIVASVIDHNGGGGPFVFVGGALLACESALRVENVTFASNEVQGDTARGLHCRPSASTRIRNVLFAGAPPHVADCELTHSLFENQPLVPGGVGNRTLSRPDFVDRAGGNYHLLSTSQARDAGDPSTASERDLDDEARPQGAWDVGADEIP